MPVSISQPFQNHFLINFAFDLDGIFDCYMFNLVKKGFKEVPFKFFIKVPKPCVKRLKNAPKSTPNLLKYPL